MLWLLPQDLVHRVARLSADADTQAAMAEVCRAWRDVVANDQRLEVHTVGFHRALHGALEAPEFIAGGRASSAVGSGCQVPPPMPTHLGKISDRLAHHPLPLAHLHLEGLSQFTHQHLTAVFAALTPILKHIKRITIVDCPNLVQLPRCLAACIGLQELTLLRISERPQPLPDFIVAMPSLRVVATDARTYDRGLFSTCSFATGEGRVPEFRVEGKRVYGQPLLEASYRQMTQGRQGSDPVLRAGMREFLSESLWRMNTTGFKDASRRQNPFR